MKEYLDQSLCKHMARINWIAHWRRLWPMNGILCIYDIFGENNNNLLIVYYCTSQDLNPLPPWLWWSFLLNQWMQRQHWRDETLTCLVNGMSEAMQSLLVLTFMCWEWECDKRIIKRLPTLMGFGEESSDAECCAKGPMTVQHKNFSLEVHSSCYEISSSQLSLLNIFFLAWLV